MRGVLSGDDVCYRLHACSVVRFVVGDLFIPFLVYVFRLSALIFIPCLHWHMFEFVI